MNEKNLARLELLEIELATLQLMARNGPRSAVRQTALSERKEELRGEVNQLRLLVQEHTSHPQPAAQHG